MKRLFIVAFLIGYLLLSGCSSPMEDTTPPDTQMPQVEPSEDNSASPVPQVEPSTNNSVPPETEQPSMFLGNMPGTKKVIPRTSTDGFSLEYITYPELSDQSSSYITEEFLDIENAFSNKSWAPISFLDNENILISAKKQDEPDYKIYRYNLKLKELNELFEDSRYTKFPDLFILNSAHFALGYTSSAVFIDNNKLSKVIKIESFQEKYREYTIPKMAVNPETGKVILLDHPDGRVFLSDLNAEEFVELPIQGAYNACWVDNENLLFSTVDKGERYAAGGAIVTYNIRNKASTKTYLGEKEEFGNPYRSSAEYYGFNFLGGYTGQPHGTIGVLDYPGQRVLFLELENVVNGLFLRNNWVVAAVADKPFDWKTWSRTSEDKVLLCVYDVATESYTIRAKNLPKPSRFVSTSSTIISPDGNTIIYLAEDKVYINKFASN